MDFMRRRTVLLSGLAAPFVARRARAADTITLRTGVIPIIDAAPFFVAMKNGYFTEKGIAFDTTTLNGGAIGVPGLVGGSLDVVLGNVVSTALAASRNLDVVVIGPATRIRTQDPNVVALIGRTDGGIASGKDMAGKTLAVNTRNSVLWLYARAWVKKTGGDPDSVTFKEVPFPQMIDVLRNKQADLAYIVNPFRMAALSDPGFKLVGEPFEQVQPGVDVGHFVSTHAFVKAHPQTAADFLVALRKGIGWYNDNLGKPALVEIICGYTGMKPDLVSRMPMAPAPEAIDPEQMAETVTLMQQNGMLKAPVDVQGFVYPPAAKA
jgi:NitT/TauT family transport system substrate-binding protein